MFTASKASPSIKNHSRELVITFSEKEEEGVLHPDDDTLVVIVKIANYSTRIVLIDNGRLSEIDNGRSSEILFWEAFVQMAITPDRLRLTPTPLKSFTRNII